MNPHRLPIVTAAAFAALLAGPPAQAKDTTALRCGEWEVLVERSDNGARLKMGDRRWIKLSGVRHPAGTRYEPLGDHATWFWDRGKYGVVSWKGEQAECRPTRHLGQQEAARENDKR